MRTWVLSAACLLAVVALATALPRPAEDKDEAKSRVARAVAADEKNEVKDQEPAASDDEEGRDKRFLFGFGRQSEEGGQGSGGGSGNFLFDLIRLIAGSGATEDSHDTTSSTGPSGSDGGYGLSNSYRAGGAAALAEAPEVDAKEDGYTSGIPGPITRLFVIGNRGVSNLIQDLILRLAQTSERIVNFKARLITSII